MRSTIRRVPHRDLGRQTRRGVASIVAAAAVLTLATPAAFAQGAPSATISAGCDGVRLGVITVDITGADGDRFIAMIDGSVLGPARLGTNEYPYQRDATSVVDVLLTLDGPITESIARESITIDCVADPTTTTTVPAAPTATAPAPAPAVANRSAAREVSFTG